MTGDPGFPGQSLSSGQLSPAKVGIMATADQPQGLPVALPATLWQNSGPPSPWRWPALWGRQSSDLPKLELDPLFPAVQPQTDLSFVT
jgi:hypothetical protein